MRRSGFTLTELMVASAMLSGVLLAAYGFLWQGFENGMDLLRRDTADVLSRNVLERYLRLPYAELDELMRGGDELDVLDLEDEVLRAGLPLDPEDLRAAGYQVKVAYLRIPGERVAAMLRTQVSWEAPGGHRRSLSHSRYLVQNEGFTTDVAAASGFSPSKHTPADWGRATRWTRRGEGPQGLASRRAAAAAAWSPATTADADAAGEGGGAGALGFRGDPEVVARLLGPRGAMARQGGDVRQIREARARRAGARFLLRSGAPREPWLVDDIPDGQYRFRLEAQDLRGPDGDGRVLGVYVLQAQVHTYHLVAEAQHAGPEASFLLEGEEVLERLHLQDRQRRPALLERTAARLYLFHMVQDPFERFLRVRTLATPDGSRAGTTRTRVAVDDLLRSEGVEPGPGQEPHELLRAAPRTVAPGEVVEGPLDPSCRGGVCTLGRKLLPVTERPRVEVTARRPAAGSAAPEREPPVTEDERWRDAAGLAEADPPAALRLLDGYLLAHPEHARARALRGQIFAGQGMEAQAMEDLRAASRQPEVAREVLPTLAGLALRAGRPDEAERLIERFRAMDPSSPLVATLEGALGDTRRFLAQVAPPTGGAPPPPPTDIGGVDEGAGSGASMSWDDGFGNSGSIRVSPPRR